MSHQRPSVSVVNPARAGMIRVLIGHGHASLSKPRASGDDPDLEVTLATKKE